MNSIFVRDSVIKQWQKDINRPTMKEKMQKFAKLFILTSNKKENMRINILLLHFFNDQNNWNSKNDYLQWMRIYWPCNLLLWSWKCVPWTCRIESPGSMLECQIPRPHPIPDLFRIFILTRSQVTHMLIKIQKALVK